MRWADLVFHVLAHVRVAAAASAYDDTWIHFVARHSGPASQRPLGEDAVVLASAAPTHDALASLQLLAWLWNDVARAGKCSDRTLDALDAEDVDDPDVLAALQRPETITAAEVLRAAAELELEVVSALPPVVPLSAVSCPVAWASDYSVEGIRSLRLRGRVYRNEILVGVPCREVGPSAEHVAWQTAHEATVACLQREALAAALPITHEALEHAAITMLREHAERIDRSDEHVRWLAHFARVPSGELSPAWRSLVDQSLRAR